MPNNWKTYKLSELIKIVGGGTPKTTEPNYWSGSIPWLSVKDFQGERKFVYETEKTITEEGLKKSSTKLLPKDSIIISARGTVGELAVLGKEMSFNQSCYGILPNEKIDNQYLYYLLKQKVLELQSLSYGSVFDTITTKTFDGLNVKLPQSIYEQQSIASILSAIDDKIENNLVINKTLEEMAMALYKHWFVDYGPFQNGEFTESELGLIPKAWKVKRLDELGKISYGSMPKKEMLSISGYPVFSGYNNVGYYPDYNCDDGKVIIVARGVGGTGDIKMTKEKCYLTNLSICIFNNFNLISDILLYYGLNYKGLHYLRTGSAQPQITINDLKKVHILIPEKSIENQFLSFFKDLMSKRDRNLKENQTLTKLRNTLLPKLISEKIRLRGFQN